MSRHRANISLVLMLAMLLATLTHLFGCEAVNVTRWPDAPPVRESVYDIDPPTRDTTPLNQPEADFAAFDRWKANEDPDAPWAALRGLVREMSQ